MAALRLNDYATAIGNISRQLVVTFNTFRIFQDGRILDLYSTKVAPVKHLFFITYVRGAADLRLVCLYKYILITSVSHEGFYNMSN